MEPIWRKLCKIQHGKDNWGEVANNVKLGERIQWYMANKHSVLLAYDSRLANFEIITIHRMNRTQQRQWIKDLDIVRDVYTPFA